MIANRYAFSSLFSLIFLAYSIDARAELNPLTCTTKGGLATDCKVVNSEIFRGEGSWDFEMDFIIPYHFSCSPGRSNDLNIAIVEAKGQPAFLRLGASATITLTGHLPLRIRDDDPKKTAFSLFNKGCALRIFPEKIQATPSLATLNQWQHEATQQTRLIDLTLSSYLALRNALTALTWNMEQVEAARDRTQKNIANIVQTYQLKFADLIYPLDYPIVEERGQIKQFADMPPIWSVIINDNSTIYDDVVLLAQLNSILNGWQAYDENDLTRTRQELLAAVARGQVILSRAQKWESIVHSQMQEINDKLHKSMNNGSI